MTRDEIFERAAREMGVSLTGAEALIAVSLMADFALAEIARHEAELRAKIVAETLSYQHLRTAQTGINS